MESANDPSVSMPPQAQTSPPTLIQDQAPRDGSIRKEWKPEEPVPDEVQQEAGETEILAEDDAINISAENGYASSSAYGSDESNSSANTALTNFPVRRRKYVRQYQSYINTLERRITKLERGPSAVVNPTMPLLPEYKVAVPELNFLNWDEYMKNKGKPIPDGHYAIDVLTDEPILYHQRQRGKRGSEASGVAQATDSGARKSEGLPSRIRINSEMVRDVLYNVSKRKFLRGDLGYPRVLLRPYKILYLYDEEIREALVELEAEVKTAEEAAEEAARKKRQNEEEHTRKDVQDSTGQQEGKSDSQVQLKDEIDADIPGPPGQDTEPKDIESDDRDDTTQTSDKDARIKPTFGDQEDNHKSEANSKPPFKTLEERLHSQEAVDDLRCLVKFMDEYLRPIQEEFEQKKRDDVTFEELWHLLRPGKLVYVFERNVSQRLWRIVQATGGRPYLSPYVPPPPVSMPPPLDPLGNPLPPPMPPPQNLRGPVFTPGYSEVSPFVMDVEYIDFNGTRFGPVFRRFHIDPFEGTQPIWSLNTVPFEYATKYRMIDPAIYEERGKRFIECTEVNHRYYSGPTIVRMPSGTQYMTNPDPTQFYGAAMPLSEETVESEVIIDFDRTFLQQPSWQPRLYDDIIFENMDIRETREADLDMNTEGIDFDYEWERQVRNDIMASINHQSQRYFMKKDVPTGIDLILLPSRVFGFILRSRKWAALDIDQLKPIKPRTHGFDDLELPEGHKPVVQALVQTHFRHLAKKKNPSASPELDEDDDQFDLVRDKGKGLIILLHGAPGVGKTSTAECVAEANNKPLLPITCGDLGITAQDVEKTLETNFRLAQAWGCVLLLDEADVFLAQRSSSDLRRNAVVSVFLRVLEYYEGILFLTTNRVGAFDEAFVSRVHLALYYPWLNEIQTTKIWGMQMRRARERVKNLVVDESAILAYAALHFKEQCRITGGTGWNGRQIRNAFQSATALAQFEAMDWENVKLEIRHFEVVAKAAAEFDDYLIRTTGFSNAERAAQNLLRADSFAPRPGNQMSWDSMNQMARGNGGLGGSGWGAGMGGNLGGGGGGFGGQMGMGGLGSQGSFGGQNLGMGMGVQQQQQQQQGYGMGINSSMGMGQPQNLNLGVQGYGTGFQSGFMPQQQQQQQQNPQQSSVWGMQPQPQGQQNMGMGMTGGVGGLHSSSSSLGQQSTTAGSGLGPGLLQQETSSSGDLANPPSQTPGLGQGHGQTGMSRQQQPQQSTLQSQFSEQPSQQSQMRFGYPGQQGQSGF